MLHNPGDYPDPEIFNPERFLKDGKINTEIRDPTTISFGFGRRYVFLFLLNVSLIQLGERSRICPGRYFAKDFALLTIASILHVFDVVPAIDSYGQPIDPTPAPTVGLVS